MRYMYVLQLIIINIALVYITYQCDGKNVPVFIHHCEGQGTHQLQNVLKYNI